MVEGGDRLLALGAENDDFVAGLDAGNLRHVEHNLVHADAADERRAFAADQQAEAVAKPAIETVGVARGDEREAHGLGGDKGAVVADYRSGRNIAHADHARFPGEDGLEVGAGGGQRSVADRLAEGRIETRNDAVERQAGAKHGLQAVARGEVDDAVRSCRAARRRRPRSAIRARRAAAMRPALLRARGAALASRGRWPRRRRRDASSRLRAGAASPGRSAPEAGSDASGLSALAAHAGVDLEVNGS